MCLLFECKVALINKQLVSAKEVFIITGLTYIDIKITIAINIRHCYTRCPVALSCYPCSISDIFKCKIAPVQIKFIWLLV